MIRVKNPYSQEVLAELLFATDSEIETALSTAHQFSRTYSHTPAHEREEILRLASHRLNDRRDSFAELIMREVGKPISLARFEVDRAIQLLRWAASEAPRFAPEAWRTDLQPWGHDGFALEMRVPVGTVLGITPFNFPLNLLLHKVAPAIAVGCPVLIKPSPFAPLTALNVLGLFEGAPQGLLQVILSEDAQTERIISDSRIRHVSFTGSSEVGHRIRSQIAGTKGLTLELGGNLWLGILDEFAPEQIQALSKKIAHAAYGFAGQSCISVQNLAVPRSQAVLWEQALQRETESFAYGDPSDSQTLCGPLIHAQARDRVRSLLQDDQVQPIALAKNLIGASRSELLPPTLVKADRQSKICRHEAFAPTLNLNTFGHEEEFIAWVNESRYGLRAGVYTERLSLAHRMMRELDVGGVCLNSIPSSRQDPHPYGGFKESGLGQEGIRAAMRELTLSKFCSWAPLS